MTEETTLSKLCVRYAELLNFDAEGEEIAVVRDAIRAEEARLRESVGVGVGAK